MRFLLLLLMIVSFLNCSFGQKKSVKHNFSEVTIETIYTDSTSIRAIEINDSLLMFGGSNGMYGTFTIDEKYKISERNIKVLDFEGKKIHFRAIASTKNHFFLLSIASPAVLYKVDKNMKEVELVYKEEHPKVFYDAMTFWNDTEGIAMGDPTDNCLSIIITRDGGETWNKISCDRLPKTSKGEAAFAASNGNIATIGDHTWIVSGGIKSRVFYSSDKGKHWKVFETPIIQGIETTGVYAVDFYDDKSGVIFGGDYTKPSENKKNKAITTDGGETWKLVSDGVGVGYKSCVRYIPNSGGKEMIVLGFTGVSISNDTGIR